MNIRIITIALLLATLPVSAQKKKTVVNDSNTPLHLLQPAYQGTYGDLTPGQVKKDIDRVFAYIDKETPARVVDKNTGKLITDYTTMGEEAQLERGAFRLASYEWGVTYSASVSYTHLRAHETKATLHGLCAEPFPLSGGSGASF